MRKVFVLLLPVLMALCACNGGGSQSEIDVDLIQNPNSAQGTDASVGLPTMDFDCDLHDFGRITEGESIAYSFHFTNRGKSDLVINGCSASCGCTVADYPKGRIAPGQDGYVTVSFNSRGKAGQQYQEVTVNANSQPSRKVLKITAQVGN
ncbi:MAG: DUF1573 domain-containing protein [Bacteroidales bacterium]|nr:DUF1573 domain-containing protein [Bacteroidales bacterium]